MFCGLGIYPWLAYSGCNHTYEIYQEDHNFGQNRGNNPVEILKERYAKGEITKEQYLQMRKTIEEN
jgi:uncharacterized membrane protein